MATSSTSPSEKKHWWLSTKKMVDKYVRDARVMMSAREQEETAAALTLLEAALSLSPRYEAALELKARCLLSLRRYKDIANMLQDYIPSYKMPPINSDDSSSDNSSRERVKLLRSPSDSNSDYDSPTSFKCFSVSDLKKKLLSRLSNNGNEDSPWRYLVLGQACCHLGLMEDALVLLQHGKRLASAAFRRESICWSDDSFSFSISISPAATETTLNHQPLSESESISHLVAQIKALLRRRAGALAALDAGLYSESIRHFSKILEGRRSAPLAFLTECYLHRSAAFKSAGRIAESIADLNRTLALDQNSTAALQARAGLFEVIGCITDAAHDLEHVKLIYNSILREPGPGWKTRSVPYKEIPGRLCALGSKIQELKQRIAMGESGKVDYYGLIGVRRGCSRSELDRAHLVLVLKQKPEKSIGFIERCEFRENREYESAKDRARMSAVLLYRLIKKGYASIAAEEAAERERKKAQMTFVPLKEVEEQRQRIQGVFCRDLAAVGSLLSQVRFNRPIALKYQALTC